MYIGVHVSFLIRFLSFLDICPVVGLLDHIGTLFLDFLRKLYTVLPSGCINVRSHQQTKRVLFSWHSRHHLLFVDLKKKKTIIFYLCFIFLSFFFLAVLDLCCCTSFALVVASRGYPLVAVHGLLIEMAFLAVKHKL